MATIVTILELNKVSSKVIHLPLIFLLIIGEVLMYTIKKVFTEGRLNSIARKKKTTKHITICICRELLHKEHQNYYGHKGDPKVTPETCDDVGERTQVILVWVRALDVWNASHPQKLEITWIRL